MKIFKDILYSEFKECLLDLYLPDKDEFSVIVFFHGGGMEGGNRSDNIELFESLAQNGFAIVTADYRMYPEAKYPEFIEDAAAAVKWTFDNINSYGKCKDIYIAGSSAGAYLSMMLCLDKKHLARHGINSDDIKGYIFDSAQPTTHFNVLKERGLDTRRVIIDEAAPIYHICENPNSAPMLILVSDNDMPNRLEQTYLFCSTLKQFGYSENKVFFKLMKGYGHTEYTNMKDENGNSIFVEIFKEFVGGTE